ncbi:MAG: hypothetical protein JWR13_2 [Mycobacterium sp.]|nr:hypothetical protein [Mycobacterium sp.]
MPTANRRAAASTSPRFIADIVHTEFEITRSSRNLLWRSEFSRSDHDNVSSLAVATPE